VVVRFDLGAIYRVAILKVNPIRAITIEPFPKKKPEQRCEHLAHTRVMSERPLPVITPETRHFWEGTRAGELRLQRCSACVKVYFPPRPFCPRCASLEVEVLRAGGRAILYSYVIHHRSVPGFVAPYSIAVVQLEEGPRMMSNIVEVAQTPEALQLDMPLQVVFRRINDDITLPLFRPVAGVL
jgi:uncharacterized OB-fold protein